MLFSILQELRGVNQWEPEIVFEQIQGVDDLRDYVFNTVGMVPVLLEKGGGGGGRIVSDHLTLLFADSESAGYNCFLCGQKT